MDRYHYKFSQILFGTPILLIILPHSSPPYQILIQMNHQEDGLLTAIESKQINQVIYWWLKRRIFEIIVYYTKINYDFFKGLLLH